MAISIVTQDPIHAMAVYKTKEHKRTAVTSLTHRQKLLLLCQVQFLVAIYLSDGGISRLFSG